MPTNRGAVGRSVLLHVVPSMRHCTSLAAIGGRERSFATELPGKEFPATADPIPKDSISRNYPLPPLLQTSYLLFQVSLWLGATYVVTGMEQIHGNWGGWRLVLARFTVHGSYLHQVPLIKMLNRSLLAISLVSTMFPVCWMPREAVKLPSVPTKINGDWDLF